jgi:FAD/FMN-containing dehydrogenase
MSQFSTVSQESIAALRSRVQGDVFAPDDAGYDAARMTWNLTIQQHPAVVVAVRTATDVAAAVSFARQQGLGVAVKSTGHGVIVPANDCLLIVTSAMADVQVDAAAQTAWIEAGAPWGAVLPMTQAVGLTPLLGSSPGVGAIGYTLGGGLGWLARKHGLACDSVRRFEVVTADGEVRTASADENADLFWALRGGGGGFAVVTGMEVQLYPVTMVFGGNLVYPAALAGQVLHRFRDWALALPEEFTAGFAIMNLPPLPIVPEFLRGKSVVMVRGCYCGPVAQGQALLQPWLDWQEPIANLFHPMPFTEVATVSNDPRDPLPSFTTGAWLRELHDDVIDTLVQFAVAKDGPSPLISTEVRYVGGAFGRVPVDAAAFSYRHATMMLGIIGIAPTPEAKAFVDQYARQFKGALQPYLDGTYTNYMEGEEGRDSASLAFSAAHLQRLSAIKATYDPDRLFNFSYDIPPAVA